MALRASCIRNSRLRRVAASSRAAVVFCSAEAIASSNILRLETSGVAMVCLSYFDANSAAHMRYTIRRIRRRLPEVRIVLGCWRTDADPTILRDTTKSDAVATSLREAVKLCLGEAHKSQELPRSDLQHAAASADAA